MKIDRWDDVCRRLDVLAANHVDTLAEQVNSQLGNLEPFDVTLTEVHSFSHGKGRYTVWLKPETETEFQVNDVHAAVWTAVSHDEDYEPRIERFTPHLSIGQVRGRDRRDELVAELQTSWAPVMFQVSEVHFIARGNPPNDIFRVEKTIPFGG
jgi:2'-5' RNA ligase